MKNEPKGTIIEFVDTEAGTDTIHKECAGEVFGGSATEPESMTERSPRQGESCCFCRLPFEMENRTAAEKVADLLGDGQTFHAADGRGLDALCYEAGSGSPEWLEGYKTGDVIRYRFPDGSRLVVAGDCWDLGLPDRDCYCMDGIGHDDNCTAAEEEFRY